MTEPAQFAGPLVERLLAIADETARSRPRLFATGSDPAVREARAAEVLERPATGGCAATLWS